MIRIEWNVKEFNKLVENYAKAFEMEAEEVVKNVALFAEGKIKEITPVDTGNLRSSIHTRFPSEKTAIIGTPVEYAPYVELGTARMTGRHMFKRGLRATRGRMIRQLKKKMQETAR